MNEVIKQEMIDAVLTARDFCGNESEAIQQVAEDFGIKVNRNDMLAIIESADMAWDTSRQEARK